MSSVKSSLVPWKIRLWKNRQIHFQANSTCVFSRLRINWLSCTLKNFVLAKFYVLICLYIKIYLSKARHDGVHLYPSRLKQAEFEASSRAARAMCNREISSQKDKKKKKISLNNVFMALKLTQGKGLCQESLAIHLHKVLP